MRPNDAVIRRWLDGGGAVTENGAGGVQNLKSGFSAGMECTGMSKDCARDPRGAKDIKDKGLDERYY